MINKNLKQLIDFYNSQPSVEYVEPNYTYQASLEPLDPYYTQQLYLTEIKAHRAWNITTGDNSVTIAIIDSGVEFEVIFGPAYKGIPLSTTIVSTLFKEFDINSSYCFNRKEAKEYADKKCFCWGSYDSRYKN